MTATNGQVEGSVAAHTIDNVTVSEGRLPL